MDITHLLFGILIVAIALGAYFIGLRHGQQQFAKGQEFFDGPLRSLTCKGFAWSIALPMSWILFYYAFVAHVRFSLGRWPNFGENLDGWLLRVHHQTVGLFALFLAGTLLLVPVIFIGSLLSQRWRHVAIYALWYAGGVGIAYWSLRAAPRPFLNWLFD